MRRIVVTAVGLCFAVGLIAVLVHSQAHGDEPATVGQAKPPASLPATFQPENERPVPTGGTVQPRMRSVLKKQTGPLAARPKREPSRQAAPPTRPKTGFTSRSLQDSPSSRRVARRNDTPQFVRPKSARKTAPIGTVGDDDQGSRYGGSNTYQAPPARLQNNTNSSRRTAKSNPPNTSIGSQSTTPEPGASQGTVPRVVAPQAVAPRATEPKGAAPIGTPRRRVAATTPRVPSAPTSDNTRTSTAPRLQLAVSGPQKIRFGKPGQYRITLVNRGSATDSVFVRIRLPKWVELSGQRSSTGVIQNGQDDAAERQLIWDIEQMGAARSETLELDLSPKKDQPFQLEVDWAVRPKTVSAKILVLKPALDLAINGPRELEFGESGIYSITLRNPGTGDAENIVLSVVPADVQPRRIPRLAAGEQIDLEVKLTARQAGSMLVQATAIADDGLRSQKSQQVRIRRADLRVQTSSPELIFAGSVARIRVDVANQGNATGRNVEATAQLPSGAKYIAGIGNAKVQNGRLTWTVGDLTAGNRRSFELQCQINVPGKSQFTVRLVDQKGNSAIHSSISRVEALADLKLTVNDPKGPRAVGDPVDYEIQIVNRGTKAALGVKLVAHFSAGIEPVKANGATGRIHPGQVVFEPISRVEAGQKITVRITARATQAGSHNIRAELSCDDPVTKLVSQESTRFFGGSTNTRSSQGGNNLSSPLSPAGGASTTGRNAPKALAPTPAKAPAGTPTLAN